MTDPLNVKEGEVAPEAPQGAAASPLPIQLALGSELSLSEAADLAREISTRVIVLAGEVECGKTTILTSLYESFRTGPVAAYRFAGSVTLPAFEKRCHFARMESRRTIPTTDRTRQVETRLLHLRVRPAGDSSPYHILFTDVSGEVFRQARDYEKEITKLSVLKRADHLAILVDGAKVLDIRTRDAAVANARSFLKRAIGTSMIGKKTIVNLIHSKVDLVRGAPNAGVVSAYIGATEQRFREEFSRDVGALGCFQIAARPSSGPLLFAYGIPDLLDKWVRESMLRGEFALPVPPPTGRPFDSFSSP